MELDNIKRMVTEGESETIEFKKSTSQLRRAFETLCGFLNGRGGRVIFGVNSLGEVVGQLVSNTTLEDIAAQIARLEPPIKINMQRLPVEGSPDRELLILDANPGDTAIPFTYDGRPYQRVGNTTSVMPQDRYRTLLLERSHNSQRWENFIAEGVKITDLDQEEILRTARSGMAAGRLPELSSMDPLDILRRLGLYADNKLANGAVVLFGTQFLPYYTQCELRMARFRGVTKQEFLDIRNIRDHAFNLLNEALIFLQRHLPTRARIEPERLERVETLLVPIEALRETLVNALIHRRYTDPGGAVSVAIYDDRIEVANDGPLPLGITPEALAGEHASKPRNPIIADVFYRRGLIEKWGRGTNRVIEACLAAGLPPPEFTVSMEHTVVRFAAPVGATAAVLAQWEELSELERRVLQAMGKESLGIAQIHARLEPSISRRSLLRLLGQLRKKGFLEATGKARAVTYKAILGP